MKQQLVICEPQSDSIGQALWKPQPLMGTPWVSPVPPPAHLVGPASPVCQPASQHPRVGGRRALLGAEPGTKGQGRLWVWSRGAAAAAHASPPWAPPTPRVCPQLCRVQEHRRRRAQPGRFPPRSGCFPVRRPRRRPHLSPWTSRALLFMAKVSRGHRANKAWPR